ncbi:MAG: hypothetical protein ACYC2T_08445 [Bacillota bacterium]
MFRILNIVNWRVKGDYQRLISEETFEGIVTYIRINGYVVRSAWDRSQASFNLPRMGNTGDAMRFCGALAIML